MFILSDTDLKFVVETVTPDPRERDRVAEAVRDKPDILDAMIGDPRLVERVLDDEEAVVHISPRLLFTILLKQTRRDLDNQPYINDIGERGEVIPVFESSRVADLLDEEPSREYLADMMSSFARTYSTVVYSLERGRLRKRRFSSMDMDDMIYAARHADPEERPDYYRRVADIALFMTGVFPHQAIRSPTAEAVCAPSDDGGLRAGGERVLRAGGEGAGYTGARGGDGDAVGEFYAGASGVKPFE